MSTEDVRKLRTSWQADRRLQRAVETAFDYIGFDDTYIEARTMAANAGYDKRSTKHLKDNVWGMVELDWSAIRLLDSPVVQRLRGIKQLGLSYLTYPSAEHSRFSHSMGMACVVSRFLDSIEKRLEESRQELPDTILYVGIDQLVPEKRADIVHAAILHDVGHMPFSHASEKVTRGELYLRG